MMFKGETMHETFKRICQWRRRFAWFPEKMTDGNWLWLGFYHERFVVCDMTKGLLFQFERIAGFERKIKAMRYSAVYLNQYADEVLPCEATLEGWAAWLARGGDDGWKAEKPTDGQVFEASTLLIFDYRKFILVNGVWIHGGIIPDHDFAAIVEDKGVEAWFVEDILSGQSIADDLAEYFSSGLGHGDPDEVWIALGKHNDKPLIATWREATKSLELEELDAKKVN